MLFKIPSILVAGAFLTATCFAKTTISCSNSSSATGIHSCDHYADWGAACKAKKGESSCQTSGCTCTYNESQVLDDMLNSWAYRAADGHGEFRDVDEATGEILIVGQESASGEIVPFQLGKTTEDGEIVVCTENLRTHHLENCDRALDLVAAGRGEEDVWCDEGDNPDCYCTDSLLDCLFSFALAGCDDFYWDGQAWVCVAPPN